MKHTAPSQGHTTEGVDWQGQDFVQIHAQRQLSLAADTEPGPDAAPWVHAPRDLDPVRERHHIVSHFQIGLR